MAAGIKGGNPRKLLKWGTNVLRTIRDDELQSIARYLVLLGCLSASTFANAELHKCKGADGSISYQDRACADGKEAVVAPTVQGRVGPPVPMKGFVPPELKYGQGCGQMPDDEKAQMIGISSSELRELCGFPDRVNRSVHERFTKEQWVYGPGSPNTLYFYLKDDVLTSFQD